MPLPLWLLAVPDTLYDPTGRRAQPIIDEIPVLLDETRAVDDAEHEHLVARIATPSCRPIGP